MYTCESRNCSEKGKKNEEWEVHKNLKGVNLKEKKKCSN